MSLSPSLHGAYARLYDRYSTGLFSFEDASGLLELNQLSALKVASRLRARGYLKVFGRLGRRKVYRLLSPEQALFSSLHLRNLGMVPQQRYHTLLVETVMQLKRTPRLGLKGAWLFGSAARGDAGANSDLDVVVYADGLRGNRVEMVRLLYSSLEIERERQFLYANGVVTDVSFIPFRTEDLGRFYPLMLDVVNEGIILFDEGGLLERARERMKRLEHVLGMSRVRAGDVWLWTVPPETRIGEPLEVRQAL